MRSIVESIMVDAMYDLPSQDIKKFTVTRDYAAEKIESANFEAIANQ